MPQKPTKLEKPLVLSPIDLDVLGLLAATGYRFLTCAHLSMICFPSVKSCSNRMGELCNAGLVTRIYLPTVEDEKPEPIYTLTRAGARELVRLRHLDPKGLTASTRKPSHFFLEHSLKISTFMCSLQCALKEKPAELVFWKNERTFRSARGKSLTVSHPLELGQRIPVVPDGLFALGKDDRTSYFFLEADRGTMFLASINRKMLGYIQLFRKRLHTQLLGLPNFRVLFVTTTPYRRDQMRAALKHIGYCPNMFLFALWEDIIPETILESIWSICHKGTLYSVLD